MRTVVAVVVLVIVVGIVRAAFADHTPAYHLTPAQCAALVADGSLTPDANGVVTCP